MSKLLSRAKVCYANAEFDYRKMMEDDCFVDGCCYNLQQSIEMSLKFLVELAGEAYAENHDIRANLNKLRFLNVVVPGEEKLRAMASTLYSWETESRYKESFVASIADIEEAFPLAQALLEHADAQIKKEPAAPAAVFPENRLP